MIQASSSYRRRRNNGVSSGGLSAEMRQNPSFDSKSRKGSEPKVIRNGDYQVLHESIMNQRDSVRQARSTLASSLDRLGEHHVRNKEYDEAMDAFTEALHEKRSVFADLSAPLIDEDAQSQLSRGSSSFLSGRLSPSFEGAMTLRSLDQSIEAVRMQTLDEVVNTLSNMGNVHSLRGEHDEAMRYYTEVMNLRATRSSYSKGDASTTCSGSRSSTSGFWGDEDTATLISELNEDVRALDELFRSISFRNGDTTENGGKKRRKRKQQDQGDLPTLDETSTAGYSEFLSPASLPNIRENTRGTRNSELSEALESYRKAIDVYTGQHFEKLEETLNTLSVRADILLQSMNTPEYKQDHKEEKGRTSREEELKLALEVYRHVLEAHEDIRSAPLSMMSDSSDEDCRHNQEASTAVASTLIKIGSLHYKLNDMDEELKMYQQAMNVYKQAFGEKHSYVAGTRKNIGMVLAERGEYDEAMSQFDKARKIYLLVSDGDELSSDVASALSCMGNVLNRMGKLDDALKRYMEALRIYKSNYAKAQEIGGDAFIDSVEDVTSTLKIVGMVHAKRGDLDGAMEFFMDAMNLLRSSSESGRDGEGVASILTRIAGIFYKKGSYDEAMAHYKEAYDITAQAHGTTNHPDIAGILHYIGGIYHKRANYSDAMSCYKEAVRIYHCTLGPGNAAVATTLVCIGSIHYKKRDLDSAMMFYKEALRLNRDTYGMHHPDVAPTLKSIGMILTKKGDYDEAYDVFREVLNIKCTVHGTGHPAVANAYKSLGNVHFKKGELADAERQYRHALSIYRRTKGEEHPETHAARRTIEHIKETMKSKGRSDNRDAGESSRSRSHKRSV